MLTEVRWVVLPFLPRETARRFVRLFGECLAS
jgi:hypothetical protein